MSVRLKDDLQLSSYPEAGSIWRVVVANTTRAKFLRDVVTFGWATTETSEKAAAWWGQDHAAGGIQTLSLGFPTHHPVTRGELFVVDMKWYTTQAPLVPLSLVLQRWEAWASGATIVQVGVAPRGEGSEGAIRGRAAALDEAAAELRKTDPITQIKNAGKTAVGVLQLAFWAVIVGGGVYLVSKTGLLRK